MSEWEKEFHDLPDDKNIMDFQKYQSEFISTLEKIIKDKTFIVVSKAQHSNLQDFENTAAYALIAIWGRS